MVPSIEMCKGGDNMWKRLLASFFIGAGLLAMSSVGYSIEANNKPKVEHVSIKTDKRKYEVTNPKKTSYSTEDKIALINGVAPPKTSITIEVYGTTDLTRKNFNLDKLPTNKDYIRIFKETIQAGNMGFFQKQLDLVMGVNKIFLDFGVESEKPYEIIVYVYDKAPTLTEIISKIK